MQIKTVRLKPDQLDRALESPLAGSYLVAGAEPLLVQEARDKIIGAAQALGFAERDVHQVTGRFDWKSLDAASGTMSLFSSSRILDVRIPTGRPGREGSKKLRQLVEDLDSETLLLVSTGAWDKSIGKTSWVKCLDEAGTIIEIWPVKPHELPGWIRARMRKAGITADDEALALLSQLVEGNLLAAQQEIDKLELSGCLDTLSGADIRSIVADSSRFNAFRLNECMLQGDLAGSLRIAQGLKRGGTVIQLVAGALFNELSLLAAALGAQRAGQGEADFFRKMRIWPGRQGPIRQALGRLDSAQVDDAFRQLALIDRQGKGMAPGDPWQSLDQLLRRLCQRGLEATGAAV